MNYYSLGLTVTVLALVVYGLRVFFRGAKGSDLEMADVTRLDAYRQLLADEIREQARGSRTR